MQEADKRLGEFTLKVALLLVSLMCIMVGLVLVAVDCRADKIEGRLDALEHRIELEGKVGGGS